MKNIFVLIFSILTLSNCSFDDKSGIWIGDQIKSNQTKNDDLQPVFKKPSGELKNIILEDIKLLNLDNSKSFKNWSQRYQNKFNNIGNLNFLNTGNYTKFKRISKSKINKNILVSNENLIFSNLKGDIGVFSLTDEKLVFKFNFYKKRLKKNDKIINLVSTNNVIIAADNFGYIYCIDYKKNKLKWAKNYLIPFRSNLKIENNILYLSDEKNNILLINLQNGEKIFDLYTQPSKTVSKFNSTLAFDNNNNLLFLSTTGSLYSLDMLNNRTINWIQNFNLDNEIIFNAKPLSVIDNIIIVSTDDNINALNTSGRKLWELNIKSTVKPIISGDTILTITDENFLVLIRKNTGQIIYSKNIYSMLNDKEKKKYERNSGKIDHVFLFDKKLLVISENSYFIEIKLDNIIALNSINKQSFNIYSDILFVNNIMIFIDDRGKVFKLF